MKRSRWAKWLPAWIVAPVLLFMAACAGTATSSGPGGGGAATTVPAVPAGLVATAGNAQVSLLWNASTGASSYNVKRSNSNGGPYTTFSSPTTSSFTDTTVTNGTKYFYVVSAVNSAGESANSGQVSATPAAPAQAPPAPTGLVATPGDDSVSLAWNTSPG